MNENKKAEHHEWVFQQQYETADGPIIVERCGKCGNGRQLLQGGVVADYPESQSDVCNKTFRWCVICGFGLQPDEQFVNPHTGNVQCAEVCPSGLHPTKPAKSHKKEEANGKP